MCIRIGRVKSVSPGMLTGVDGTASVPEDALYIDCTATAAPRSGTEPIWQGEDTIVPQLMQVPLVSLSAAAAGFIEGQFETDAEKNALGAPGRITDTVEHFPEALLINATNRMLWSGSKAVTRWLSDNRLDPGARMVKALAQASPEMQAAAKSIRGETVAAVPNLQKLVLAEQAREKRARKGGGMMRSLAMLGAAVLLAGCTTMAGERIDHPEAALYDSGQDAASALANAKEEARQTGSLVLAVFGANWCHDSRAMAGWLETERFRSLRTQYRVVYIDSGTPQSGEGRNLDLAGNYGVTGIEGTPTVLVIAPDNPIALNAATAKSWRNAASRSGDAIHAELAGYAAAHASR